MNVRYDKHFINIMIRSTWSSEYRNKVRFTSHHSEANSQKHIENKHDK